MHVGLAEIKVSTVNKEETKVQATWNNLISDIQVQLPLGLPELKALSLVNKHWRTFALNQMLRILSRHRYPLERLGFKKATVDSILNQYGSSLQYLHTDTDLLQRVRFCTNLEGLSLSVSSMRAGATSQEEIIEILKSLNQSKLTSLNLSWIDQTPRILQKLGTYLTSLKELDISVLHLHDPFSNIIPTLTSTFTAMSKLNLRVNRLGGTDAVESLKALSNSLTDLNVECCRLDELDAITIVTSLTALKTLNMNTNEFLNTTLEAICTSTLTSLTEFHFGNNKASSLGIEMLSTSLRNLTSLDLKHVKEVRGQFNHLASNLMNLTELDLAGEGCCHYRENATCQRFTPEDYQAMATMIGLKTLDLSHAPFGFKYFIHNFKTLTRLECLKLNECQTIDDTLTICKTFTSLKALQYNNSWSGHNGVIAFANYFTSLTSLSIGGNEIDNKVLYTLSTKITTLTSLHVGICHIDKAMYLALKKFFGEKGNYFYLDPSYVKEV